MLYAAISPNGQVVALGQGRDETRENSISRGIRTPILVPYQVITSLKGITGIEKSEKRFFKKRGWETRNMPNDNGDEKILQDFINTIEKPCVPFIGGPSSGDDLGTVSSILASGDKTPPAEKTRVTSIRDLKLDSQNPMDFDFLCHFS